MTAYSPDRDQLSLSSDLAPRLSQTRRLSRSVPSLLKWSGSKRSQARAIANLIPSHDRYFEPFLGGGAVLFCVGRRGAVAGDIYRPLVDFWKKVQREPERVITAYATEWTSLQRRFPEHYYDVRDRFNRKPNAQDLCFLTRTCVNGIVRFNANGQFNNSIHLSRRGMRPNRFATIVRAWSHAVQGVTFVCGDYKTTIHDSQEGDFVYLDPPYVGTKQRYTQTINLDELFETLDRLNATGVRWALSWMGDAEQRI